MKKGIKPDSNLAISTLAPEERKQVLKEIALHVTEKPVSAGQRIAAIKELNLMEHIYDPSPQLQDNRQYQIIIAGGPDAKEKLERLLSGEMPPLKQHSRESDE